MDTYRGDQRPPKRPKWPIQSSAWIRMNSVECPEYIVLYDYNLWHDTIPLWPRIIETGKKNVFLSDLWALLSDPTYHSLLLIWLYEENKIPLKSTSSCLNIPCFWKCDKQDMTWHRWLKSKHLVWCMTSVFQCPILVLV